ncbi:MAG: hypothetical protein MUC60_14820 [Oscillatoria sp. Prado101]|nr:hypothetical protein [Oscillatoria sp. Prado101]
MPVLLARSCLWPGECSSRSVPSPLHRVVLRNPVSLRNRVSGMYFVQLKTAIYKVPAAHPHRHPTSPPNP